MSIECASRVKQPVDAIQHILVLYKFAPVGLRDTSLNAGDEAGLTVEHAGNCVFHQLLGVLAVGRGHLVEPCLNVGREMNFHALQGTRKPAIGQRRKRKRRAMRLNPAKSSTCCKRTGSYTNDGSRAEGQLDRRLA